MVKVLCSFYFQVYSFFGNEIFIKTSFRVIISGIVLSKRISSTSHALMSRLLAPKLLMPRKSQVPTVGILPNKRSQLDRLSFGMGNPFGQRPGYCRIKGMFKSILPIVDRSTVYVILCFMNDIQVPILNAGDCKSKEPHKKLAAQ